MTSNPLFLVERGGIYYVRLTVAKALRRRFPVAELRWSLRTRHERRARMLALKARDDFDRLCRFVKSLPSMHKQEVAQLLQKFRAQQEALIPASPPEDDWDDWIDEQVYCAQEAAIELRQQAQTGVVSPALSAQAEKLADQEGVKLSAFEAAHLRRGMAGILAEQAEAEADAWLDPLPSLGISDGQFKSLINSPPIGPTSPPVPISQPGQHPPSITLKQLIDEFLAAKKSEITKQTLSEYRRFLGLVGLLWGQDRPAAELGKADLQLLSDRMKVMRTHLKAGTPPSDWDTADPAKQIAQKTRKKYFELAKSLIKWGHQWGKLTHDFGANVPCPKVKSNGPQTKRPSFTNADLNFFFSSPLFAGCASKGGNTPRERAQPGPHLRRDAFFWVPLVAALTAMRQDEILQLRKCDVRQEDDVWYFDLNGDDGKTIKTDTSWRKVPIHSRLLTLGLLDYVQGAGKTAKVAIFREIVTASQGHPKAYYSQWFGRYMQYIAFQTPNVVFHSFRHTVIDHLRNVSAPDYVLGGITGHFDKKALQTHGYGAGQSLKERAKWIEQIDPFWLDAP